MNSTNTFGNNDIHTTYRFEEFVSRVRPAANCEVKFNIDDISSPSESSLDFSDLEEFIKISESLISSDDSSGDSKESLIECSKKDVDNKFSERVQKMSKGNSVSVAIGADQIENENIKPHSSKPKIQLKKAGAKKECPFCGKFLTRDYMKNHIRDVHKKDIRFQCDVCMVSYYKKSGLKKHLIQHFKDLKSAFKMKKSNAIFKCNFTGCSKSFKSKRRLGYHQKIHSGKNKMIKFSCDYNFKGLDERSFLCQCGKAFKLHCYLRNHQRLVHSGEKIPLKILLDDLTLKF